MSTIKVDTLQTRSGSTAAVTGAGFVATDQIKGNTTATTVTLPTTTNIGATAIVSGSAGSATIIGEGGTNTTNLQQGLSKAWINCNGQGTVAIRDSFNITSITDNGTGDTSVTIANDMGNGNYCPTMGVANYNGGQDGRYIVQLKTTTDDDWTTIAVSSIRVMCKEIANSTNFTDASLITISMDGDLA